MPTNFEHVEGREAFESWQRRRLLDGELSPAEYAARVVDHPYLRRTSRRYRVQTQNLSPSRPLIRNRVLLSLALIAGLFGLAAFRFGWLDGAVFAPGLIAGFALILTAFSVARSSAAQEIWLLNHEVRRQRSQISAFETYGSHLQQCWRALQYEDDARGVTADFIQASLDRTRRTMEEIGHEDVALAILRREANHYFVAYVSYPVDSALGAQIEVSLTKADELFAGLNSDVFTHLNPFELAETEHELLAVSREEFGPSETWLLCQLATYCSTAGNLHRSQ